LVRYSLMPVSVRGSSIVVRGTCDKISQYTTMILDPIPRVGDSSILCYAGPGKHNPSRTVHTQASAEVILAVCRGLMKSDACGQRLYMRLGAKLCAGEYA
jgi:hypothetical protein